MRLNVFRRCLRRLSGEYLNFDFYARWVVCSTHRACYVFRFPKSIKGTVFCVTFSLVRKSNQRDVFTFFLLLQKEPKSSCSDASKVAGGKFWRVGDRRNREYCERTRTRRPCFKETIAKYPDFDFGWLVLGLDAANGGLNGKLHVILGAVKMGN